MAKYMVKRLLLGAVALFGLSIVVFSLIRMLPGDPALVIAGEEAALDPSYLEEVRREYLLDRPVYEQYVAWFSKAVRFDLGESTWTGDPVTTQLRRSFPVTLNLVIPSFFGAIVLAVVFGVVAAANQDRWADHVTRLISVGALSVPDFAIAMIVMLVLLTQFGWSQPFTYVSPLDDPLANVKLFALPVGIIAFRYSASGMRMTRNTMLEVLREDYIRTARAKGLSQYRVVLFHAFRNALIPVVTVMGLQLTYLLSGSVIIERVFALPGMGTQLVDSVTRRDYPQLQGAVLLFGTLLIGVNLVVDLLYVVLDPRVRY